MLPPVLVGEIVAVPALGAFEDDFFAWHVVLNVSRQPSAISHQRSIVGSGGVARLAPRAISLGRLVADG
jgi:hypothetical protein